MIKDVLGNDLKVGDWIDVGHLIPKLFCGPIIELKEGGVVVPSRMDPKGGAIPITPGVIRVQLELVINFGPGQPLSTHKIAIPPHIQAQLNASEA